MAEDADLKPVSYNYASRGFFSAAENFHILLWCCGTNQNDEELA
jgi:hypothetical protein